VLVWHVNLLRLVPFVRNIAGPVTLFLHGIEAWTKHDPLTRRLLCGVDGFLSNSNYTWERFLTFYPNLRKARHRTVHLGTLHGLSGVTPKSNERPTALMIGRMRRSEDYKGHRQMIEAWPLVLKENAEAQLSIVGDGDLRLDLERLAAAHGLAKHVCFWGAVSETSKEHLIAQSRCLVLPSRGEGFGLVYLEAMRLGRPCLVSNLDAGREIVNPPEAGLAVDPSNPRQVAEATLRLLKPGPEWRDWSISARRRYETNFTVGHFQQRLIMSLFTPQHAGSCL
jgi:phosphatidylinositol alpha-1,6-mannosyltransferase